MEVVIEPEPLLELSTGVLMLVATILVHGLGLRAITRRFSRAWSHVKTGTAHWRVNLLIAGIVGMLVALHILETLIFAAPIALSGILPSMRDSYIFVLESYTTLGEGAQRLPDRWRLLGPIIAMAGLFTFGWTGSVLVSVMGQVGRLDSAQAREQLDDPRTDVK